MKTILIPTDFTQDSFQVIEESIQYFKEENLNIVLFHSFEMPKSLQDVASSSSKPHLQVMSEGFRKSCRRIKEKWSRQVGNIHFRHMYGDSMSVFRSYLEYNKIDVIVYPSSFVWQKAHARSIDPTKMIRRSGHAVINSVTPDFIRSLTTLNKNEACY